MLTLRDLSTLCRRYVPIVSRHPNAWEGPFWWPAHELGHLLTVPSTAIGLPMFGLDDDADPGLDNAHARRCRELAAMAVSRKLLTACGRIDLADQEVEDTDYDTLTYDYDEGGASRVRAILREHRCLRVPRTREGLEAKLRRVVRTSVQADQLVAV